MVRELRRFEAADDAGRRYTLCEVAAFVQVGDCHVMDGSPELYAASGQTVLPDVEDGTYRIPALGVAVREVPAPVPPPPRAAVLAAMPMSR